MLPYIKIYEQNNIHDKFHVKECNEVFLCGEFESEIVFALYVCLCRLLAVKSSAHVHWLI